MAREVINVKGPVNFIERNGEAVTPSDSTEVEYTSLYVGSAGNVAVQLAGSNSSITYANVQDGSFMPIEVIKVFSTGTTASNIIGHF